ncbi:MAG TPA: RDD family protein [Methylomirabilota bacterium]|jgi:uncharacterized RDD family membrane protein YckC|nr:RDD family protein [Methylomirabilota bacterium]
MEATPLDWASTPWGTGAAVPTHDDAGPATVGFWRRAVALIIDLGAVWVLLRMGDLLTVALARRVLVARAFGYTCFLVIPAAYFVLMHGTGGRTLGKRLIGARVVTMTGAPLSYPRAFARYLASFAAILPLAAGYLMVAARADKRGLHDLLAGTRVVRSR